jgi:peroxiredoxin
MAELEAGAREMLHTFPNSPGVYQFLMTVAARTQDPSKAERLAQEIVSAPAYPDTKESATILLHWLSRLHRPLELRFTTIDGRNVDLNTLRGKVVLVQFWASWCAYCTDELPLIRAAYDQYHERGFEIVGISYDTTREELTRFLSERQIPWPQYNDGLGRAGPIAKQLEVFEIPTLWLVDKKGLLREIDVREGLADKVEKLLAEQP